MRNLFFTLVFLALMTYVFSISGSSVSYMLDIPSLVFVVIFSFIALLTTYNFREILTNFSSGFRKVKDTEKIRQTVLFLEFEEKTLFYVGILGFLTGIISALATISELEKIGPALAVALITPLYATLINLLIVRPLIVNKKREL